MKKFTIAFIFAFLGCFTMCNNDDPIVDNGNESVDGSDSTSVAQDSLEYIATAGSSIAYLLDLNDFKRKYQYPIIQKSEISYIIKIPAEGATFEFAQNPDARYIIYNFYSPYSLATYVDTMMPITNAFFPDSPALSSTHDGKTYHYYPYEKFPEEFKVETNSSISEPFKLKFQIGRNTLGEEIKYVFHNDVLSKECLMHRGGDYIYVALFIYQDSASL